MSFLNHLNLFIIKPLIVIFTAITLGGCVTQNRCVKKFPPQVKETYTSSIEIKEVIRDTIIFKEIPGEIVERIDTVLIGINGLINSKVSFLKTSLAWSKAQVIDSKLFHELHQNDTVLEFELKDAIREIDRLERELHEKVTTIAVPRELTKWQKFRLGLANLSLLSLLVLVVFVVARALK